MSLAQTLRDATLSAFGKLTDAEQQGAIRALDEANARLESLLDYIGDKTRTGNDAARPAHWSRARALIQARGQELFGGAQGAAKKRPKIPPLMQAPYNAEGARAAAIRTGELWALAQDFGRGMEKAFPGEGALAAVEKFVSEVEVNQKAHAEHAGYEAPPLRHAQAAITEVAAERKAEEVKAAQARGEFTLSPTAMVAIGGGVLGVAILIVGIAAAKRAKNESRR